MSTGNSAQVTGPGQSFAALDFETATGKRNSACAVGVVVFNEQGQPTDTLHKLIRPPGNHYSSHNTKIHGIGPSDTRHAPGFPDVWDQVTQLLGERMVVTHNTDFDMSVLRNSAEHHRYAPRPFLYVCTCRIARAVMPRGASCSLATLTNKFGIPLTHHDPLSDANAAGLLWLALLKRYGPTPADLCTAVGYRPGVFQAGNQSVSPVAAQRRQRWRRPSR